MTGNQRALDVYLGGRLAGRLHSDDGRHLEFEYDLDYTAAIDATALSLSMPVTRRQHPAATATNYFEGLLPEHGPARERLELDSGVPRTDSMGLLAYLGRDLPGAVALVDGGVGLPADGGLIDLDDRELARIVADLRRSATQWRARPRAWAMVPRWSAGEGCACSSCGKVGDSHGSDAYDTHRQTRDTGIRGFRPA